MWHAAWRREERVLIQVSAPAQRPQPVLRVEESLHIGGLPCKCLLQLLSQHKSPSTWRICFAASAIHGSSAKSPLQSPSENCPVLQVAHDNLSQRDRPR